MSGKTIHSNFKVETYALTSSWNDFPEEVRLHAQMCGIDLMSALILGSYGRQFAIGEKVASGCGMDGDIHVIGSRHGYNLPGAAVVMGHASNSFDIDDGHRQIQGHPGTSFIAGVMAAAYRKNITIRGLLETLVVCYELTIRWAMVMQRHYHYLHSTGTYGAWGTAVGIGRILGLSKEQLNNALSIADYHAPLTPVMRAVEYPSMNKDGVPFGALVGTMAIVETLCGSTGKTHLLEFPEYADFVDDLGKKYHILELYFKPYTCCRWAHQPIRAIIDLRGKYGFTHDDVADVTVRTFRSATLLSKKVPDDTEEAQYNIAYPVACALVHGDVGFMQVRDEALKNADVLGMMEKLRFVEDGQFEAQFPQKRFASVSIRLNDGRVLESGAYEAPGEPDDPELGLEWIENKFRRITAPMLDTQGQEAVIETFTKRHDTSVRDFVEYLNDQLRTNI